MNEKLNLVEILKDCPNGMELDCTMFDNVKFIGVENYEKPICIRIGNKGTYFHLTQYGTLDFDENAKCVIYPKDKTTWEGFIPPCKFNDGDIVATNSGLQVFILQRQKSYSEGYCYIGYDFGLNDIFHAGKWQFSRLATEEEKQKLFDTIKKRGYKWNAETKTLEKFVEPKFNPNILRPFDKVLVRDYSTIYWNCDLFSRIDDSTSNHKFITISSAYRFCIPYNEETKHLIGTTEEAPEYYRYWED